MILARSERIDLPVGKPLYTPILLPSFSSKGFPELKRIMKHLEEYISGPILISAYDVRNSKIKRIPFSPDLLFIDSGGYECSNITDFIEYDKHCYKPNDWNQKLYFETMKYVLVKDDITKVLVNYDHPYRRISIKQQIKSADLTFGKLYKIKNNFFKEILIKPETGYKDEQYIPIDKFVRSIKKFKPFDIIGFTEKELGRSLSEIMVNIYKIRQALMKNKMKQLIHIFGALDPISTPLYFICGADIFDGLTWLRYSFYEGLTVYQQNYWFKQCPLDSENFALRLRSFVDNFAYLKDMYFQMRNFQKSGDFSKFKYHGELFRGIWDKVETLLQGGD